MKKTIVFQHLMKKHHLTKIEMEFDIDTTEEEIKESYVDWVWSIVGDILLGMKKITKIHKCK